MKPLVALTLALLLFAASCTTETEAFNTGESQVAVPANQLWPVHQVLDTPDPAAVDDALAQIEADTGPDQIAVFADITDCFLLEANALPGPDQLFVDTHVEDVACFVGTDYRLVFVIDTVGSNDLGDWDYRAGAPVKVNKTFSPSPFAD